MREVRPNEHKPLDVGVNAPAPTCRSAGDRRLPSAPSVDEPENEQKQDGADGGGDDGRHDPGTEVDAQLRQQPTADQGANDADADVGNHAEAGAANHLARKPSGDQTDQQDDEETFGRHGYAP